MVLWPLNRWRKSPETPLYFYILQENIKGTRKCSFCTQKCIFSCLRFGSFKNFSYLCSAKEIQQIPEKQPPLPHFRHPITLQLPSHRSTVVRRPSPSSLYSLQPYITRVLWLIDTKAPLSSRPREVALCLTAGLDLRKEDAINKYPRIFTHSAGQDPRYRACLQCKRSTSLYPTEHAFFPNWAHLCIEWSIALYPTEHSSTPSLHIDSNL